MIRGLFPNVYTNFNGHDQLMNLSDHLYMKERWIAINGEITDDVASAIVFRILYLYKIDNNAPIVLVINSRGGSVDAGLAIYDAMKHVQCDVYTVATGIAASMGALLLAAGTKGKRYATPSAEIMIHQPLGGVHGQATDISLVAEHIQQIKKKLASILADSCSKPVKILLKDFERDNWKTSAEAVEYGLIDHVGYPENM